MNQQELCNITLVLSNTEVPIQEIILLTHLGHRCSLLMIYGGKKSDSDEQNKNSMIMDFPVHTLQKVSVNFTVKLLTTSCQSISRYFYGHP